MSRLPKEAFRYFWDVDPEGLDAECDASFIIQRLFEWGDCGEVRWLLNAYPLERLKSELRGCRSLNPKNVSFWANLLDVLPGDIRCIQRRSRRPLESVWPY